MNSNRATTSSATAAASTGRRPTWSDSAPTTSSDAIRPSTYTANTTVNVVAENPHDCWYTTYKGEGALDAARNSTRIVATPAKATGCGSRRRPTVLVGRSR